MAAAVRNGHVTIWLLCNRDPAKMISTTSMSQKTPTPLQGLRSLGLANFKAFGPNLQQIPLKPITLIFGANSSGKSSLLHFLLWLNDVMKNRKLDVCFPMAAREEVDLGGFKQMRHGNNLSAQIQVRMNLTIDDARKQPRKLEITSHLGTSQPPADHAARLRELVRARFQESRSKNSIDTIAVNIEHFEQRILRETLTELIGEECGVGSLNLRLQDCFSGEDKYIQPIDKLRERASPKLHELVGFLRQQLANKLCVAPKEETGVTVGEDSPAPSMGNGEGEFESRTSEKILGGLQSLACAVLEELEQLDFNQPPSPEGIPMLMRFEMRERGSIVLAAERKEDRRFTATHLNVDWLACFIGSSQEKRRKCKTAWDAASISVIFDDANSWLPRKLRYPDDSDKAFREFALAVEGNEDAPGLLEKCEAAAKEACGNLSYLAPVRAIPPRNMNAAELPREHDAKGWHAWRRLYEDDELRNRVSKWLQSEGVRAAYDIEADHRFGWAKASESISRDLAARISQFYSETSEIKDYLFEHPGSNLAGVHEDRAYNSEAYQKWNEWIRKALDVTFASLRSESCGTVILRDRRSGKEVSSKDVGIGISQMIPVLVGAMDARDEIIAIEQPEIHLHPALQAELGDLFIESAMTRGNRFVLETHSEHLILRIMRRIRETTAGKLPEGMTGLKKEDVAVLYVERSPEGSVIREMPLTDDGDFAVPWPGGFFPERLAELF